MKERLLAFLVRRFGGKVFYVNDYEPKHQCFATSSREKAHADQKSFSSLRPTLHTCVSIDEKPI